MSSYFRLGPQQTGEKYWPLRLPATPISGPLLDSKLLNPYQLRSSNHGLKSEFLTWEEDIQHGIGRWPEILAHDPAALKRFEEENKLPSPHADLVHRRWGFVIIRTVYSEESEALIDGVMEKIHTWMMADLDAILEPGVVLSAEQREKMSKSFMNLLLDDKAVYDGLELEEVYLWFKGFLRTHELDWALVRGLEEPYDAKDTDEWPPEPREQQYDWGTEQHSCCNPNCLHPPHLQLLTDVISRDENDEARKAQQIALDRQSWEARDEAYARCSYGKPFYLHPEILEQAKAETDLKKKYELMKEAEWKLSAQACFVLDLKVMRSITEHDVDPDKYEELTYTEGPFLKISLEEKMHHDGDSPSQALCGKCHLAVNPLAMVYTQMAEESQHEFDIEWCYNRDEEWNMLLRRDTGWDGPSYPELQSVIGKERVDGCPKRAAKDGDLGLVKRLRAERDARWEELMRKTPFDEEKHKKWEELQRQKPEEIEYQKQFGRGLAEEEAANYEAAWASAYPK